MDDIYNSIKVGEHIYFEVAPKSSAILHYKTTKQEDSEVPRNVATYTRENYPSSKTKQAAFTREDRNILKEFYTKKVKSRLRIIALLSIPIIGLAYKGWASLLIFIFPVPLILIYQLYQFVKLHLNYKKSIAKGRKELTTTLVIDKLFTTISHNGSIRQKYTLKTTYKNVEVPEIIYQNIYAEEEITLHEAKDLKYLLGISVDETYFPVL